MRPRKQLHNPLCVTVPRTFCRSELAVPPKRTLYSSAATTAPLPSAEAAEEDEEAGAAYSELAGKESTVCQPITACSTAVLSESSSFYGRHPQRSDNATIYVNLPLNPNSVSFCARSTTRPYECVTHFVTLPSSEEERDSHLSAGERERDLRDEKEDEENPLFFSDEDDADIDEGQATSSADAKPIAPCGRLLLHFQANKDTAEKKHKSIFLSARRTLSKRPRETRQYIEKMEEKRFHHRNWLDKALLRHSLSHTLHRRRVFFQQKLPALLFGDTFREALVETSERDGGDQDLPRKTEEVAQLMQFVMGGGARRNSSGTPIPRSKTKMLFTSLRYHATHQFYTSRAQETTGRREGVPDEQNVG